METCGTNSTCALACNEVQYNPLLPPDICTWPQLLASLAVYGYALYQGANMIGDGAELLLLVPSMAPIVGSVVLPVLGAVPDGMMILFSGLGDDAQKQVSVGVGALAGSTIMLLTLPWFLAIYGGRVSITGGVAQYKRPMNAPADWDKLMPPGSMSLSGTGVKYDTEIKDSSKFMLITLIGYLIIQGPAFKVDKMFASPISQETDGTKIAQEAFQESHSERYYALGGMMVCIVAFVYYLWKMYRESQNSDGKIHEKIAEKSVEAIFEGKLTLRGALSKFRTSKLSTLRNDNDLTEALNKTDILEEVRSMCRVLAPFFSHYDANGDNQIDKEEFRMIFKDVRENLPKEAQIQMFESADTDRSGYISFEEFVACCMAFALDPANDVSEAPQKYKKNAMAIYFGDGKDAESNMPGGDDEEGDGDEEDMPEDLASLSPEEQQKRIKRRAFSGMLLGSLLVIVFSDPTVDVMSAMGDKLGVPGFYISFFLAPIASNATELLAAYRVAKKRTVKSITTALAVLLGAGIMNNTFCLAIFLGLVYFKQLAWQFTAETLAIVLIEAFIGILAYSKAKMTLRDGLLILMCYPLSPMLVYVLENHVGID